MTQLVGLTRSVGPIFKSRGITINAILPSFTPTNLTPQALHDMIPEPYVTPMKAILEAYDTLIDSPHLSGEILELIVDKTYFLKQPKYAYTRIEFFEKLLQPDISKEHL
jgi:NAD(P)-dependent dehydrogenase (short-subunit alcohol dehydrogenase family)